MWCLYQVFDGSESPQKIDWALERLHRAMAWSPSGPWMVELHPRGLKIIHMLNHPRRFPPWRYRYPSLAMHRHAVADRIDRIDARLASFCKR